MTEFQWSSKYPDGTIIKVNDNDPKVGEAAFLDCKDSYEKATGTAPIKPFTGAPAPAFQGPSTVTPEQGHANVVQAFPGTQAVNGPPAPLGARPGDGELHPTKTCVDCGSPMKVVDRPKKDDPSKRYRKLECSVTYKHKQDWSENYTGGR